jgi:L-amino acid N-acyltransferase YncA
MRKLIRALREHGTQRLVATVLTQNHHMLALAQELGFVQCQPSLADGTREISLMLRSTVTASE